MAKGGASDGEEGLDSFWLRDLYPEAAEALFFAQKPLAEIKEDCIVVLDANVLLLPYRLGATSLEDIKNLFGGLAAADRIFLPAQAVREFLKHRANKIRDVLRDLSNQASQIQVVADRKIGFLEADPGYQELVDLSQKIKELKTASLKTISQISDRLRSDVGSDPVTSVYRDIFTDRVVDLQGAEDEEIKNEMRWRFRHSVPPGYKDKNKSDEGIGDLVIWKTILQLAASKFVNCIFVTEDAKSDWWVQSEGVFQPRLELVDEYRRASAGKTIHLLPLSGLLELLGAKSDTIDEARQAEIARQSRVAVHIEKTKRRHGIKNSRPLDAPDYGDLDKSSLLEEMGRLYYEWRNANHQRVSLDRLLRDSANISTLADEEIADMYRKRDALAAYSLSMHMQRKRLENALKSIVSPED